METILIIGGTGAQGIPVIKALTSDRKYAVRVITRSAATLEAQLLAKLHGVTIVEGDCYDESTLRNILPGVDRVFANTNGLVIGEIAEVYWGIRLYELAREFGVKHFVYASLPYASKIGNFNDKYRVGHCDSKARIAEYISAQPTSPMAWSIIRSCLYIESLTEFLLPAYEPSDDVHVFALPLGQGRIPMITLDDNAAYVRWTIDNLPESNGLDLNVVTDSITGNDLAAAFSKVTGKKSVYRDVSLDEYFRLPIFPDPDAKLGPSGVLTVRKNFSGLWNSWKDDLWKWDHQVLDRVLPTRIKSTEEWMVKTGYTGKAVPLLKDFKFVEK
ncbi:NmrA family domain-containing protein 1 [Trichoderma lentiforme]|uniref:NmrA family domain-containing protein 1 n=1 Tax=Trichoderma lentiforme TaxID=1567552 RepID=A0A9P4X530_9HYPO|nr:NmrA family domain-containing protein 1 [Trichoderma lentiforme]